MTCSGCDEDVETFGYKPHHLCGNCLLKRMRSAEDQVHKLQGVIRRVRDGTASLSKSLTIHLPEER